MLSSTEIYFVRMSVLSAADDLIADGTRYELCWWQHDYMIVDAILVVMNIFCSVRFLVGQRHDSKLVSRIFFLFWLCIFSWICTNITNLLYWPVQQNKCDKNFENTFIKQFLSLFLFCIYQKNSKKCCNLILRSPGLQHNQVSTDMLTLSSTSASACSPYGDVEDKATAAECLRTLSSQWRRM